MPLGRVSILEAVIATNRMRRLIVDGDLASPSFSRGLNLKNTL